MRRHNTEAKKQKKRKISCAFLMQRGFVINSQDDCGASRQQKPQSDRCQTKKSDINKGVEAKDICVFSCSLNSVYK